MTDDNGAGPASARAPGEVPEQDPGEGDWSASFDQEIADAQEAERQLLYKALFAVAVVIVVVVVRALFFA